jgi:hypothetical protein
MPNIMDIWDEGANVLEAFAEGEIEGMDEEQAQELENRALAYLNELAKQEANKVDAIGYVQDKAKSQIDLLKDQEDKIRARRKAMERAQQRFRDFLLQAMQKHGIQKVKGNSRTIFRRNNESVEIDGSPQDLPEQYREVKVEYRPLKKEIKDALKKGEVIQGARLESKESVQVR